MVLFRCPECGQWIDRTDAFCSNCGHPASHANVAGSQMPASPQVPSPDGPAASASAAQGPSLDGAQEANRQAVLGSQPGMQPDCAPAPSPGCSSSKRKKLSSAGKLALSLGICGAVLLVAALLLLFLPNLKTTTLPPAQLEEWESGQFLKLSHGEDVASVRSVLGIEDEILGESSLYYHCVPWRGYEGELACLFDDDGSLIILRWTPYLSDSSAERKPTDLTQLKDTIIENCSQKFGSPEIKEGTTDDFCDFMYYWYLPYSSKGYNLFLYETDQELSGVEFSVYFFDN